MGYINSLETMGLVDGPGIRFVVFMQGCPLRCIFCHNPETWEKESKLEMTPKEVVSMALKYKNYFNENGGITFSGGEPLMQSDFLLETLKLCKKDEIHTCIDTSGFGGTLTEEVLKYTDLVLLDVKALDSPAYKYITGSGIEEYLEFIDKLTKSKTEVWIRQVIIPGINDNIEYVKELKEFISKIENVSKIELLPYHRMAINKYDKLGIKYKLSDTKDMDKNKLEELSKILR